MEYSDISKVKVSEVTYLTWHLLLNRNGIGPRSLTKTTYSSWVRIWVAWNGLVISVLGPPLTLWLHSNFILYRVHSNSYIL